MIVLPKEWSELSKRFVSQRENLVVEEVLVASDVTALTRWVEAVYRSLEGHWSDSHVGQDLPVTEGELFSYFVTALRSRVAHVNPRSGRSQVGVSDTWYLPAPFAVVLSMLGYIEREDAVGRVEPVWNTELDQWVLEYPQWLIITQKMRRIELDSDAKILLFHAIEKDKRGDERLMNLVPQVDEMGNVVAVRNNGREVDPIVATTFLILSLKPSIVVGPILSPAERRFLPFFQPAAIADAIAVAMSEAKGVSSR